MARRIAAVLAGLVVVGVVVGALQYLGAQLHPMPAGLDPMDPAQRDVVSAWAATLPRGAWALAFGSELLGAFLGALTAGRIARDRRAWLAGGIVLIALLGSLNNWRSFEHPTWFIVGQLVAYPLVLIGVVALLPGGGAAEREAAAG